MLQFFYKIPLTFVEVAKTLTKSTTFAKRQQAAIDALCLCIL